MKRVLFLTAILGFSQFAARAQSSAILIDDFENGVGAWTRNDKVRADSLAANPDATVSLVDITSTRPNAGLPAEMQSSKGAALFSFKSAKGSWASVSTRVDGARWAKIGAKTMTFYIEAAGENQTTELTLRARRKTASGKFVEEKFVMPIRLNIKRWRKVTIPFAVVKNEKGTLLSSLSNVYLLQFVQNGTWNSRFFTVDQMQVEGSGVPLAVATPTPAATPVATPTSTRTPTTTLPGVASFNIDFKKVLGRVPTSANISVGSVLDENGARRFPLLDSASFRNAVKVLAPRMIRLDASALVEMTDSSKPSFDFNRLAAAIRQARALGAEPLIAINNDAAWGLDANGFAQFASQVARAAMAKNTGNAKLGVRFEIALLAPSNLTTTLSDAEIVTLYNRAHSAIKSVSPALVVGGLAVSSTRTNTLNTFLKGARGLDFLSLQFYGAPSGTPDQAQLLAGAKSLSSVRAAANALDKSRFRRALLFLTQSNMSGGRDATSGAPLDARLSTLASGAWWLTYLSNASNRLTDQVFHNDATDAQWGLLSEQNLAFPAFHAMWLWNNYAPRGADFVGVTPSVASNTSSNVSVFATNARLPGARAGDLPTHNVLLANTRGENTTVKISIRGFAKMKSVTLRVLDDVKIGIRQPIELTKSATQTITLKPYAIAVVQWTEPAKR